MVLPLLGSFLASSFLPAMTGLSPLMAGAIGSGLGSLAQGDDFDEAIANGLFSYMGGKLLGGLDTKFAKPVPVSGTDFAGKAITPDMASNLMTQNAAAKPAIDKAVGDALGSDLYKPDNLMGMMKQNLAYAKANPMQSIGSGLGSMAAGLMKPPEDSTKKSTYRPSETMPYQGENISFPTTGYQPGVSAEHNYGFYNPSAGELQTKFIASGGLARYAKPSMLGFSAQLASGGLAALAEGGMPEEETPEMPMDNVNEKDVIVNAVNAVKGNLPEEQAAIVLAQFVEQYGEEALRDLVEDVQNGDYDNVGGKADGMVEGGGDGMSDSVPATIDGAEDLLVSKDEYVVDAPTVAMIGNGSSEAGAKKLDNMREEVRKAATGSRVQPNRIDATGIMSAALA